MEIRKSFTYPEITKEHFVFGAQNAGDILRPDGDWRDGTAPAERQSKNGIESSACYLESQQHSVADIQGFKYGEKRNNYSARFNVILSGGTPSGGDPLKGADSIRNDGLINDSMMPFDDSITSWSDFASWKGVIEKWCRAAGKLFTKRWDIHYYIVFKREDSLEVKYANLKEALKRSPVPISVYGVVEANGQYVPKPTGVSDTHLVEARYCSNDNVITIFDTYPPFVKTLPANYVSDFAMRHDVQKIDYQAPQTLGQVIKNIFNSLCSVFYK